MRAHFEGLKPLTEVHGMDKFIINGGPRLKGQVTISGSKNAALPILAATLLPDGPSTICGVPDLADIRAMCDLLVDLGAEVHRDEPGELHITSSRTRPATPTTTSSARCGRASACWARCWPSAARPACPCPAAAPSATAPVDLHLRGLRGPGRRDRPRRRRHRRHGRAGSRAPSIFLGGPFGSTVLGTANVMMAATLAEGTTVIESAACEPEVVDLADFLNAMRRQDHRRRHAADRHRGRRAARTAATHRSSPTASRPARS